MDYKSLPVLKHGDKGHDVQVLQALLQSRGFFNGVTQGNFLNKTRDSVAYWQQTHLGPDGRFLDVDGIVGPDTWWSLYNPVGAPQKSNIKGVIPGGLSDDRTKFLQTCLAEHTAGVAESPMGSNWGDGVTKYLTGIGPAFWCCFYVSWCYHNTFGKYPLDKRFGSCIDFWRTAKKAGRAFDKNTYQPIPGDIFIMLFRNGKGHLTGQGHTGTVLAVNNGSTAFNTLEGNAGDRVKVGMRSVGQSTLVGYINLFDGDRSFDRFLLDAEKADNSVAGTR
jgi:hypothetical protein